jgi:dihydroorotate dehydrogenase electron transfer subunit
MSVTAIAREAGAVLVDQRDAGQYRVSTIHAPGIVAHAQPGQFVSVAVGAALTLLRRPFAIANIDGRRGTFDVVVADVGQGSAWMTEQVTGCTLDVVGPLGHGFTLPSARTACVLVGGGYGTAALEWLRERLRSLGHDVELLSGAATAAALYPIARGDGDTGMVIETTEDGSRGRRGLVTAALTERVGHRPDAKIFACGPMPMLAAVAAIAARAGCDCQVAVEEHMGCSVGVCMTCVVPTVEGYVRACIEGPVLDAQRVDWSATEARGTPPPDRSPAHPPGSSGGAPLAPTVDTPPATAEERSRD